MKNKTLLTLCAAPLLLSVNAMADGGGAVTIAGDLNPTVNINEDYEERTHSQDGVTVKKFRYMQPHTPVNLLQINPQL